MTFTGLVWQRAEIETICFDIDGTCKTSLKYNGLAKVVEVKELVFFMGRPVPSSMMTLLGAV